MMRLIVLLLAPALLFADRDHAAGDLSKLVQIALYRGTLVGDPNPNSEIARLRPGLRDNSLKFSMK